MRCSSSRFAAIVAWISTPKVKPTSPPLKGVGKESLASAAPKAATRDPPTKTIRSWKKPSGRYCPGSSAW